AKSEGFELVIRQIREAAGKTDRYGQLIRENLDNLLSVWNELQETGDREVTETSAKPLFKDLIHLYQMALIGDEMDAANEQWMKPALDYLASELDTELKVRKAPEPEVIRDLIGWEY
ncbi:MAG TPA: hypothetical protein VJ905_10465, partial [Halalkalibaculum sp.]|nr:hypothetical protein [Halalkalibaculum sp.]